MQRGDFESTALSTNVATSAKQSNIEVGSLARGMAAFGEGLGAISKVMGKFAEMADKAYGAKQTAQKGLDNSLDGLKSAIENQNFVREQWKNAPDSDEKTQAIANAERSVSTARQDYAKSFDTYHRVGMFSSVKKDGSIVGLNGTASAASGEKRIFTAGGSIDKETGLYDFDNKKIKSTTFWDAFMTNGRGSHMK